MAVVGAISTPAPRVGVLAANLTNNVAESSAPLVVLALNLGRHLSRVVRGWAWRQLVNSQAQAQAQTLSLGLSELGRLGLS